MAPITRSSRSATALAVNGTNTAFLGAQESRESSWEFAGSEPRSEDSRAASEEPGSYNEEFDYDDNNRTPLVHPHQDRPENHEDILHPLREAANRVGREVERFAQVLDGYNPSKAVGNANRREMAVNVLKLYQNIAKETVKRLCEHHQSKGRREEAIRWQKKFRGIKIVQDPDMMMDDADTDDFDNVETDPKAGTMEDLQRWEQEYYTWDLLLRIVDPPNNDTPLEAVHRYSPEHHVWDTFLSKDPIARKRNIILKWLKDTADDSGEEIDELVKDLQQNADRGDLVAHGWLHTKSAIKKQKRLHGLPQVLDPSSPDFQKIHLNSSRTEPLVTQLDPDAPTRQGRKLEVQDEYFDRAIWLGCYEMLRRGKSLETIKEWCRERMEVWRAISMSGLPDTGAQVSDGSPDFTSRALWRRMCYALARRSGGDEYERAVYGILSGDLQTVEHVCESWHDYIFAHYNALLSSQYDAYLRTSHPGRIPTDAIQAFGDFDAVTFHGDPESTSQRLIKLLRRKGDLQLESREPLKMLQGVLIADDFGNFALQQGVSFAKLANVNSKSKLMLDLKIDPEEHAWMSYITFDDYDSMRVLTHMLIVFKCLGLFEDLSDSDMYLVDNSIVAYINFLRLSGNEELIPLYASQLSEMRTYAVLSRVLLDITDTKQRMNQIRLMKELGLDVQKFVRYQTLWLLQDHNDTLEGYPAKGRFKILDDDPKSAENRKLRPDFIGSATDQVDMLLIRSLEWHLLVEGMWSETFHIGALLYKRFFKNMNLAAAKELAIRVSSGSISQSKTLVLLGECLDFEALEADIEDDDDISDQVDVSAAQAKLLKRHMVAEAKSFRDLEKLITALAFTENIGVAIEKLELGAKEGITKHNRDVNRRLFNHNLGDLKDCVNTLLKGDWLIMSQEEEPQLTLLRDSYLPEVLLAYTSVLYSAGFTFSRNHLLECMNLSTIIAAEDSDLADLFVRTGRMAELVTAFAVNSKALLELNSGDKPTSAPTKKIRALGWTRDLWRIPEIQIQNDTIVVDE